jgi:hypothetical protein
MADLRIIIPGRVVRDFRHHQILPVDKNDCLTSYAAACEPGSEICSYGRCSTIQCNAYRGSGLAAGTSNLRIITRCL